MYLDAKVSNVPDSTIYILYAMECDNYDTPIFADDQDWPNIRRKFTYSLINNQLLLTE